MIRVVRMTITEGEQRSLEGRVVSVLRSHEGNMTGTWFVILLVETDE